MFLECSARIYEFGEAFLHSKVVTVDGGLALVGSANMDTRSFRINFELSLLLYDGEVTGQLVREFDRTLERSVEVLPRTRADASLLRDFGEGLCRVLSPLL